MVIKAKFLRLVSTTNITHDVHLVNVVLSSSSENDCISEFVRVKQHRAGNDLVTVERTAMGSNSHFSRSFSLAKDLPELVRVVRAHDKKVLRDLGDVTKFVV